MGPMGERPSLGTVTGKGNWVGAGDGGFGFGCLDPEEPRIIPVAFIFVSWVVLGSADVPVVFPLGGLGLPSGRACVLI